MLGILAATFAATTVYFARELARERDRTPAAVSQVAQSREEVSGQTDLPVATPVTQNAPDSQAKPVALQGENTGNWGSVNGRKFSEGEMKKQQEQFARQTLAQLSDPQQREELLDQSLLMMRSMYPGLARALGLTREEHSRFLELLAQQQLRDQEGTMRCILDSQCQMQSQYQNWGNANSPEMKALLGTERGQKFESYKSSLNERHAVTQFRNRLAESNRLDSDTTEKLILALARERESIEREISGNGTGVNSVGLGGVTVISPNDDRPLEQRLEAARQYSQRLRDSAAAYLNAEQLRAFDEMQGETLQELPNILSYQEGGRFSAVSIAVPAPQPD